LTSTKMIGITGSCGKTSTTSFLGKIISDYSPCQVGVDNNTRKAVIKSIQKASRSHRFLVQEVAVAAPGDMAGITPLLLPDIGVVTTIGQDHYSNFRTLEATAAEKVGLIKSLPESGVAVLNADDPNVIAMSEFARGRVLTYGVSERADVRGSDIQSSWPERLSLNVAFKGESVRIKTGVFGDLMTTSVLAAVAGALAAGFDLQQSARSLEGIETFDRRMSIHHTPSGMWFVNDAFKAPYWSVEKVVSLLKKAKAPRKTLVLGSLSDTPGSMSSKYRSLAKLGLVVADRVVLVGEKSKHIRKLITPALADRLFAVGSVEKACRLLADTAMKDELVLVKSNKLSHLERLIYGQAAELQCWKETCDKTISCEKCEESGLASL